MRVVSSLADIEFHVGEVRRQGGNLIVESSPESTLETTVTITPRDALTAVKALLVSGATWRFLAGLPFAKSGGSGTGEDERWAQRRSRTGLNKPW